MQRFINSASFPFPPFPSPLLCHNFEALTLNFCRDGGRPSSSEEEIGSLREQEVQVHAAFPRNDFEFPASFCDPGRKSPPREMDDGIRDSGKIYEHARTLAPSRSTAPSSGLSSFRLRRPSPSLWSGISSERAPRLALGSSTAAVIVIISGGGPNLQAGDP